MTQKKHKILLADDDEMIQQLYRAGLEQAGFEVVIAADGEEAIRKLKQESPDMVLLDLMMPKKNGLEVLAEMRQDKNLSRIPVIILSSLDQDVDIRVSRELGAADYLIKSQNTPQEVAEKIKKQLQ